MSEHAWSGQYEEALRRLEDYIVHAPDGTVSLKIKDGRDIGIDPVVFADIQRSMDETNKHVRNGEFKIGQEWKFEPKSD